MSAIKSIESIGSRAYLESRSLVALVRAGMLGPESPSNLREIARTLREEPARTARTP